MIGNWFRGFWEFIKYAFRDTAKDIRWMKESFKNKEAKIDERKLEGMKQVMKEYLKNPFKLITDNWIFFLAILVAIVSAWWIASLFYQQECNRFILEQIMNYTDVGGGTYVDATQPIPLEHWR